MAIVKWEPFSTRPWFRFPRWLEEDLEGPWEEVSRGLNVYETGSDVVVEATVPGVPTDKVEVSVEGGIITIRGEVEEKEEEEPTITPRPLLGPSRLMRQRLRLEMGW